MRILEVKGPTREHEVGLGEPERRKEAGSSWHDTASELPGASALETDTDQKGNG
ncbi:MAG: hypothetical protein LUO89_03445 [Methanothrix sp.]|nr:hypothetical protein [Methanothrix sp.]